MFRFVVALTVVTPPLVCTEQREPDEQEPAATLLAPVDSAKQSRADAGMSVRPVRAIAAEPQGPAEPQAVAADRAVGVGAGECAIPLGRDAEMREAERRFDACRDRSRGV